MKFIILSQVRSGSSLLAEMLNSHSEIQCDGEIFNRKRFKYRRGKIKRFFADYWPYLIVWLHQRKQKKAHYGFKLHSSQLKNPATFIDRLYNKGFIILDLRRNNVIQKAFSASIAFSTNKWSVRKEEDRLSSPIEINPTLLFKCLEHAEEQNTLQDTLLIGKKYIRIVYENDLIDELKQAEFSKRICEQLQIPIEPIKGNYIKTDERPLSERISNYQELMTLIQQSRFAQYLNN